MNNGESENSLSNRIAEQDPEAYALLQEIMYKPALFVGSNRFDYVDFLFGGYCWGRGSDIEFLPNAELQYWLLHTQSASIHGSITGSDLFYRCFGSRQTAFDNYRVFIHYKVPCNPNCVDSELYTYEEKHNTVRYEWEDDVPPDHHDKLAQNVIENIHKMISIAGFSHDIIRIYVRKERLFNQIRFLFQNREDWIPDDEIISKPENHELLVAIHANARNATTESLRNLGCDVFDTLFYDNNSFPSADTFPDDITFASEYSHWKEKIMRQSRIKIKYQ